MTISTTPSPYKLVEQFSPLNQISHKYHAQLLKHMKLVPFKTGEVILRNSQNTGLSHYLVEGDIEVRHSFDHRLPLSGSQNAHVAALESLLEERSTIRATSPVTILVVNNEQVDQLLAWSQDINIFYLDDNGFDLQGDTLIDDDYQEDWDNNFIRSSLAANLSHNAIHQLLSSLEDMTVNAGEVIVKKHSEGDYFYIIKQGIAEVLTDPQGPYQGSRIELEAGHYFGDEALVAGTIRNASVHMKTAGVLGRLSGERFLELIKPHLVSTVTEAASFEQENIQLLDIRFPLERKVNPLRTSTSSLNVPIAELRSRLGELKPSMLYIIAPGNDSRSELATYLLRQAGFEAYQMPVSH